MPKALCGTLIKESLTDDRVLDLLEIKEVQIWKATNHTPNQPAYWTAIAFSAGPECFLAELADSLRPEWYVDLSSSREKIVVLPHRVIRYPIGDAEGRKSAVEACRLAGIPETQIDWKE